MEKNIFVARGAAEWENHHSAWEFHIDETP